MYVYRYVHIGVYIYICKYSCIYIYLCTYICVYTYICIRTHVGCCQNYGPFLGPRYNTAPSIQGTRKGTIILRTTHIPFVPKRDWWIPRAGPFARLPRLGPARDLTWGSRGPTGESSMGLITTIDITSIYTYICLSFSLCLSLH